MVEKLAGETFMTAAKLKHFVDLLHKGKPVEISSDTLIETSTSEKYIISYSNTERFFVKRIPDYAANRDAVSARYELQKHLQSKNFPACVPMVFDNTPYTVYENDVWQVFPFYDGDGFKKNSHSVRATTMFLTDFHQSVGKYALREEVPTHSVAMAEMFLESAFKEMGANQVAFFDGVKSALYIAKKALFQDKVSHIWCHGDFSPNNILYKGNDPLYLLDFDNAHFNSRFHDVAEMSMTLSMFEYDSYKTNFSTHLPGVENLGQVGDIVNTYLAECTLTSEERKKIPYYFVLVYIELIFLGLLRKDFSVSLENAQKAADACHFMLSDDFLKEILQ